MPASSTKRSDSNQNYLPRGGACVSCRRRKMKCDGQHPVCGQCDRAGRPDDCEYVVGQERSTVQILEENISLLEARIQELQNPQRVATPLRLHQPYVGPGAPPPSSGASRSATASAMTGRTNVGDPPRNLAESLLGNFMPYASDVGFFLNLSRFRVSMFQPNPIGHNSRPAPCLIFAIYLWAIRLSVEPSVQANEEAYMQRATQEAATALSGSHPQRVLHSIQAEVLLSTYFFAQGRFLEGKYHVANAVSTVLSAGLHKIRSASGSGQTNPSNPIIPAPRDPLEEGERIIGAWTVFNLDKAWAVALDSSPNFQHSSHAMGIKIDTPWPLEMEEFEQGVLPQHARTSNTVNNFLAGVITQDLGLSLRALEAKAIVLWDRAENFVKKYNPTLSRPDASQHNLGAILQEFSALSSLLDIQIAALPPVAASPTSQSGTRAPPTERIRRTLLVHSIIGAAVIRLHSPFASNGRSETSRRKRVDGARLVLAALIGARGRSGQGPMAAHAGWLNPVIGSTWVEAAQVLFDEVAIIRAMGHDDRSLLSFIQEATSIMSEFGLNMRLMNFQVQKIQETFSTL